MIPSSKSSRSDVDARPPVDCRIYNNIRNDIESRWVSFSTSILQRETIHLGQRFLTHLPEYFLSFNRPRLQIFVLGGLVAGTAFDPLRRTGEKSRINRYKKIVDEGGHSLTLLSSSRFSAACLWNKLRGSSPSSIMLSGSCNIDASLFSDNLSFVSAFFLSAFASFQKILN